MKKICILLLTTIFASPMMANELDTKREKVKHYFISNEEPKVKDAVWMSPTTFKVGVKDDGTPRNGYAEYVCLVLYDNSLKGKNILVNVVDIDKLISTGKWINLGTAKCN